MFNSKRGGDLVSTEPRWLRVQITWARPFGVHVNQVMRYEHAGEYLTPEVRGVPVSAKFNTWEEAEKVRDLLRQGESRFYYNIVHCATVAVIDRETSDGSDS